MPTSKGWFCEGKIPGKRKKGIKHCFLIEKIIFKRKSKVQDILIFKNPVYGKILIIDGILQLAQRDEFIYHEMISHPVLFSHPQAKKILILGGGDGGALREVLKHKVKKVDLVEADELMIKLAQTHLKFVSQNAFSDKRVRIFIEKGEEFVKKTKEKQDIVIVDCLNFGQESSLSLFELKFYQRIFEILTEKGILITLGASLLDFENFVKKIYQRIKEVFPKVFILRFCVPSFHCGEYCFLIGSKKIDFQKVKIKQKFEKFKEKNSLKYFSPEVFKTSLILPNFLKI